MSFHHRILAWTYPPLRAVKAIGRPLGLASPDRLRVLLYHDVAPHEQANLAAQLRWLAGRWRFINPERFAAMVSGEEVRGSNLMVTFDDGLASNRTVAEQVLNPMGIRAIFFVPSDFVAIEDRLEARRFISRHIFPDTRPEDLPEHWGNMRWADLEALLEQGHTIGGHTATHARLAHVATASQLEDEIASSADAMQTRLGAPIDHFAYTFGDVASFSEPAMKVAKRRFRFVYSGLRGDNAGAVSPFALRRDVITSEEPNALLGAFVEGVADFRYARSRAVLDSWA